MKIILTLLWLVISLTLLAQENPQTGILRITFPINRTTIQQNSSEIANVSIAGEFYGNDFYDNKCQFRVVFLNPTNGFPLGNPSWTTISTTGISDGKVRLFLHNEVINKGWYQLEVRLRKKKGFFSFCFNNDPNSSCWYDTATQKVKFGVGDVFLNFGQSNSTGYKDELTDQGLVGNTTASNYTQRDAVNTISREPLALTNFKIQGFPFDNIGFRRLDLNSKIYPSGPVSWCYAPLGDKLIEAFQSPVLFLNAGTPGTTIAQLGNPNFYEYKRFRNTLQLYAHILGLRGILWQQGEYDARKQLQNGTFDYSYYTQDLFNLIQQSRKDIGENNTPNSNLTWNVAQSSFYTFPSDPTNQGSTDPYCVHNSNQGFGGNQQLPHECQDLGSHFNDYQDYNQSLTASQLAILTYPTPMTNLPNVRQGISTDDLGLSTRGQHQGIHFSGETHSVVAEKLKNTNIQTGNPLEGKTLHEITVSKETNPYFGGDAYKLTAPSGFDAYFWAENEDGIYDANFVNFKRGQEVYVPYNSNSLKYYTCYMGKNTGQPSGIGNNTDGWNLKFEMTQPFLVPGYKDLTTISLNLSTYLYQISNSTYDNSFNIISENVVWEADETDSWITIGPDENIGGGDGTTSLMVHIDENTDANMRIGNIYVRNEDGSLLRTLRIEQQGTALPCGNNLSLSSPSDDYNSSITKRAIISIDATNKINNGANVEYKAGNSILLQAGFKVENGAVFKATIPNDPCND